MSDVKTTTVRLAADQANELAAVASVDGTSVSGAIRGAIEAHIAARRADPEFQAHLRKMLDERSDILDRLAR